MSNNNNQVLDHEKNHESFSTTITLPVTAQIRDDAFLLSVPANSTISCRVPKNNIGKEAHFQPLKKVFLYDAHQDKYVGVGMKTRSSESPSIILPPYIKHVTKCFSTSSLEVGENGTIYHCAIEEQVVVKPWGSIFLNPHNINPQIEAMSEYIESCISSSKDSKTRTIFLDTDISVYNWGLKYDDDTNNNDTLIKGFDSASALFINLNSNIHEFLKKMIAHFSDNVHANSTSNFTPALYHSIQMLKHLSVYDTISNEDKYDDIVFHHDFQEVISIWDAGSTVDLYDMLHKSSAKIETVIAASLIQPFLFQSSAERLEIEEILRMVLGQACADVIHSACDTQRSFRIVSLYSGSVYSKLDTSIEENQSLAERSLFVYLIRLLAATRVFTDEIKEKNPNCTHPGYKSLKFLQSRTAFVSYNYCSKIHIDCLEKLIDHYCISSYAVVFPEFSYPDLVNRYQIIKVDILNKPNALQTITTNVSNMQYETVYQVNGVPLSQITGEYIRNVGIANQVLAACMINFTINENYKCPDYLCTTFSLLGSQLLNMNTPLRSQSMVFFNCVNGFGLDNLENLLIPTELANLGLEYEDNPNYTKVNISIIHLSHRPETINFQTLNVPIPKCTEPPTELVTLYFGPDKRHDTKEQKKDNNNAVNLSNYQVEEGEEGEEDKKDDTEKNKIFISHDQKTRSTTNTITTLQKRESLSPQKRARQRGLFFTTKKNPDRVNSPIVILPASSSSGDESSSVVYSIHSESGEDSSSAGRGVKKLRTTQLCGLNSNRGEGGHNSSSEKKNEKNSSGIFSYFKRKFINGSSTSEKESIGYIEDAEQLLIIPKTEFIIPTDCTEEGIFLMEKINELCLDLQKTSSGPKQKSLASMTDPDTNGERKLRLLKREYRRDESTSIQLESVQQALSEIEDLKKKCVTIVRGRK